MGWVFIQCCTRTIERIYLKVPVPLEARLSSDLHKKGLQAADRQVVILMATNVN